MRNIENFDSHEALVSALTEASSVPIEFKSLRTLAGSKLGLLDYKVQSIIAVFTIISGAFGKKLENKNKALDPETRTFFASFLFSLGTWSVFARFSIGDMFVLARFSLSDMFVLTRLPGATSLYYKYSAPSSFLNY